MIKNILITAVILSTLAACNTRNNVKIKGEIKEASEQKVYLEQLDVDNAVIIDSTKTNKKGEFTFKTMVQSPTFFSIKIGPKEAVTVLLEPDEQIELSGTFPGISQNYWVDGSENSLWIKLLNFQLHNTQTALDSLQKDYQALSKEAELAAQREVISNAWDSVMLKQINFSKDFILKHAISPASYYALYQKFSNGEFILNPYRDLQSYKIVASSLKAMHPESQYTKAILKHLGQINKNIQNEKIKQLIASSESKLPEIRLPNQKGDTIALSSVKTKLIILDFTSLTAQGSESYTQDMKKVYDKFKSRGVQIYQVCLDENKAAWENTIRRNQLDWICVIDEDATHSRAAKSWNVQSIPANYILNSKSEIVGKNLTGRRLEERLTDLLK